MADPIRLLPLAPLPVLLTPPTVSEGVGDNASGAAPAPVSPVGSSSPLSTDSSSPASVSHSTEISPAASSSKPPPKPKILRSSFEIIEQGVSRNLNSSDSQKSESWMSRTGLRFGLGMPLPPLPTLVVGMETTLFASNPSADPHPNNSAYSAIPLVGAQNLGVFGQYDLDPYVNHLTVSARVAASTSGFRLRDACFEGGLAGAYALPRPGWHPLSGIPVFPNTLKNITLSPQVRVGLEVGTTCVQFKDRVSQHMTAGIGVQIESNGWRGALIVGPLAAITSITTLRALRLGDFEGGL